MARTDWPPETPLGLLPPDVAEAVESLVEDGDPESIQYALVFAEQLLVLFGIEQVRAIVASPTRWAAM